MRESHIEAYLRKRVKASGGKCWKWVSPGRRGVPDRIVLLPGAVIAFVETKAPGDTERADQRYVQALLRNLGFLVFSSVDSKSAVDVIMVMLNDLTERRRLHDL